MPEIVTTDSAGRARYHIRATWILAGVAAAAIFAFDLTVPLGMAGGVPYVALILAALWLPWRFAPFVLAAVATLLTVAGYFLSPKGGAEWVVYANRALAVAVIWIAAVLVFRRVMSQKALEDSEARLRAVIDTAVDGVIITDAHGLVQTYNPACERLFGFKAAEVIGQNARMLMAPPDRDEHDDYLSRYRETGEARIIGVGREVTGRREDGSTFPMELSVGEARHADEPVFIAIVRDLSGHKRTAEEMRRLGLVWQQMSEGVLIVDSEGRILDWNPGAEALFGYSKDDVLGKLMAEVNGGIGEESIRQAIAETVDRDGHWSGEIETRRKDGAQIICEVSVLPLKDESGEIIGRIGVTRDITERRRMEDAVRRLATIVESSEDAIVGTTLDGAVSDWNTGAERMLGYTGEEIVGKSISLLIPDERSDEAAQILRSIRDGTQVDQLETVYRRKDGTLVDVSLTTSPIRDVEGNVVAGSAIIRDITELKRAAAAQRQVTKMEALGQLAGGVAHDFNNILFPITTITEAIRDGFAPGSLERANLEKVLLAARRGKELVAQILAFSRLQPVELHAVRLDDIVRESVGFLRATLPATIEIRSRFEADVGAVLADPTQIQEVIMNLGTNAAHAIGGEPGRIEFALERVTVEDRIIVGSTTLSPAPYVKPTVTDTGAGMDRATLERIFDPYFTTKPVGEGTGMGLAVVHAIISSHRGAITASSAPGRGTTFEIYLPILHDC